MTPRSGSEPVARSIIAQLASVLPVKRVTRDPCFLSKPSPSAPTRQYDAAVHAVLEGLYRLLGSCAVRSDPAILCTGRSFFLCVLPAEDKLGPRTFLEGLEQSLQQRDPETCWPGCRRVEVLGNRVLQSTFIRVMDAGRNPAAVRCALTAGL